MTQLYIEGRQMLQDLAEMRSKVKRLLRKHGYPPDKQEAAVITVIEQAEQVCREWGVSA